VAEQTRQGVLLEDELYQVRVNGRVVWCKIFIPAGLPPTRGAKVAETIVDYLVVNVALKGSPWLGIVIDITQGPSVVGPATLRACERVFRAAEMSKKPLAVLVGSPATQRAQFDSLCQQFAPFYSTVVDSPDAAHDWMTATRSAR
jgi:hypothetical protein